MSQPDHTATRPVVYLHIGTMKSGTTYLQQRLSANRDSLARHGVNWPGRSWGAQVRAVNDLLDWRPGKPEPRLWNEMAAALLAHRGTSILSMEFLFVAQPHQIEHVASTLAGADLHVVLTLRDSTAAAPSQWQTDVRSGMKTSWADYARSMAIVGRASPRLTTRVPMMKAARHFALRHSVELVLGPWLSRIPPEHFHTVLVPMSREDPDLLWKRFREATSIPPESAPERPRFARQSLGYASASLVSRVNKKFDATRAPAYRIMVRRFLCEEVLSPHSELEAPIPLTRQVYRAGIRQNIRNRRALIASSVPVIGNLDELPVTPDEARLAVLPAEVEEPNLDEYLVAADTAIAALDAKAAALGSSHSTTADHEASGDRMAGWRTAADPARAATDAVVIALRAGLRAYHDADGSGPRTGLAGD